MKKFKKVFLIAAMAATLGGGIGAAVAAVTANAGAGTGSAEFDSAINLYWGSGETTAVLNNIDSLEQDVAVYRYLAVNPKSTKNVAGNVTLTFTLSVSENKTAKGLTIDVFKTDALATDETVATAISGKTKAAYLNETRLSDTTNFAVIAGEAAHETHAYYVIAVKWDGTVDGEKQIGCHLDIGQSFAA